MKNRNPKKILIFNVNWLGDVLFSTAVIRNIRRNFPGAFLACAIPPRCYPVLKGNPYLDEIIIFDESDRHKGIFEQMRFVRDLRMKKFDLVFLLHRSATRALLCRLAGIPERIGHRTRKRAFLLTHSIIPPKKDEVHRIDYYLSIIQAAGIRVEDRFLDFFSSDEDAVFVSDFLKRNGVRGDDFVAVLNPGGNWLPKRWPKEYWAALADRLTKELGAKIVISGSAADQSLARHIQQAMLAKPVIACGALNLKQLAALAKRADLFITADTGPLHIANAVGSKQIIAIFGPTSPKITGPYPAKNVVVLHKEIGCAIPCYVAHCPDNRCMKAITPEDVVEKIREVKHETRNPKL